LSQTDGLPVVPTAAPPGEAARPECPVTPSRLLALLLCAAGCLPPSDRPDRPAEGSTVDTPGWDSGLADSGELEEDCVAAPFPVCDATREEVYATAIADHADACPGEVLTCAPGGTVALSSIADLMPAEITATTGYLEERIAYRTTRSDGRPAVGSAMVFRPESPVEGLPVLVAPHGTVGLADACAPSQNAGGNLSLILPYVATGHIVIAVDYAGLGTEGVQGYGDRRDAARSTLDGTTALLARVDALGMPTPQVVVAGYSQGGATAMAARDIAESYLPEVSIHAHMSFAGGLGGAADLPLDDSLPSHPVTDEDGTRLALLAMRLYADHAAIVGESQAGGVFAESVRDTFTEALETTCIRGLTESLSTAAGGYTPPTRVDELVDAGHLEALMACIDGTEGCTDTAAAWHARLAEPPPAPSPTAGPLLYVSGSEDTVHTPEARACTLAELEAAGVAADGCLEAGLGHVDIVHFTVARALAWTHGETWTCADPIDAPACPAP